MYINAICYGVSHLFLSTVDESTFTMPYNIDFREAFSRQLSAVSKDHKIKGKEGSPNIMPSCFL
ncbi:MAG: hypothetical protein ABH870_02215 [bacterium]